MRILLTPVAILFEFNFILNFYSLQYWLIHLSVMLVVLKVWFAVSCYAGVPPVNISTYFHNLRNHKELVWMAGWVFASCSDLMQTFPNTKSLLQILIVTQWWLCNQTFFWGSPTLTINNWSKGRTVCVINCNFFPLLNLYRNINIFRNI